jgi:hypothetical protein
MYPSHFSIFHVVDFISKKKSSMACSMQASEDPTWARPNSLGGHEVARQVWLPCSAKIKGNKGGSTSIIIDPFFFKIQSYYLQVM